MTNAQRKPIALPSDEEEARIQAGIAQDPDNPELTDEELASMRPARDVLPPELFASLTRAPATETVRKGMYRGKTKTIKTTQESMKERIAKRGRYRRDRPTLEAPGKQRA